MARKSTEAEELSFGILVKAPLVTLYMPLCEFKFADGYVCTCFCVCMVGGGGGRRVVWDVCVGGVRWWGCGICEGCEMCGVVDWSCNARYPL